jgi:hypothetical protein
MKKRIATALILAGIFVWTIGPHGPVGAQTGGSTSVLYLPLVQNGYDPTWQWRATEIVNLSPSPFDNPFLAIDHAGRVHVFWDTWSSGGAAFIYQTYQDGNGWTAPAPIANTLGVSKLLIPPVVTPDGDIHLVWYNDLAIGGPYRLMYASFDGNRWGPEEEITRFTSPYPGAVLNYDDQGNLHIVYREPSLFTDPSFYRVLVQGTWSDPINITPGSGGQVIFWDLELDRSGGVRFYGRDLDYQLVYSYWRGGAFQSELTPVTGFTWPHSFDTLLDASDNLHVYRDASVPVPGGSVNGLYHLCLDSSLNWDSEQVLSGYDSIGNGAYVARDNAGGVAFGWKDYNAAEFSLALLKGCSKPVRKVGQLPETTRWGDLSAVALSRQPGKFCALVEIPFYSQTQGLACADLLD